MNAFDRYAPFIQEHIYRSGWHMLRAVQNATAEAIFNSDTDVLVMASTASGKTEAVFFPILTLLTEHPPISVGVLYIAPLKALINDQFNRIDEICETADIKVTKWHGEASLSQKRKLLNNPSGIVQITPESLESLLINRHNALPLLFNDLRFIVIDELHSLLRNDRGGQTFCLIERLCRITNIHPRRIGLSATIGNPTEAAKFLSAGSIRKTTIPQFESPKEIWHIAMEHFYTTPPQASEPDSPTSPCEIQSNDPNTAHSLYPGPGIDYIYKHSQGKKCLVFTNSREECETVCQQLRRCCEINGEAERFLIHHGNLSSAFRLSAEADLKDDDSLMSVCATATLELGIDVGRLERAFQLDAPFTVSGFLQRMGRTGRRGTPAEMFFVMRENHADPRITMPSTIPWYLLQGIALIQLYIEERFVEPPRMDKLPYSLLYHQTMSTLASSGELSPASLASKVLPLHYFHRITQDDFRILLNHLIQIQHIEKTENGGLIVGIKAEPIVNNYKFYAVFQENPEYKVRAGSDEIGTIVRPAPVGEQIAIAGRVWTVDEIDNQKRIVYCTLVKGAVPAYFGDVAGDINTRILERMLSVLQENKSYPYLMQNAINRLSQARKLALHTNLTTKPLICLGEKMWALFPWLGTYAFIALERFLKLRCAPQLGMKGFKSSKPYFMEFTMQVNEMEFYKIVKQELQKGIHPLDLLYPKENPVFEKYDEFVPQELVRKGFAFGVFDIETMKKRIISWLLP